MTKIHFVKHRQRFQDVAFQANSKNPIKNPYRVKHINLHSNHHWQKLLSLLLPGSTKKKKFRPGNSLLQHVQNTINSTLQFTVPHTKS